ncbi:MAG: Fic family protein [Rhodospirillaceae bacterium]|nr:Fic family protein [Rhodospirillaceae bacterium]
MADSIALMEPMMPEEGRRDLDDLATDLVAKSSALAARLHPVVRRSVGDLVRSMNCYYSNLIEGHNTTPIDIAKAMQNDYSKDKKKRVLQLEARAHIEVQEMIDRGDAPAPVVSREFILWVHKEFCSRLPDELLWLENPDTGERINVVPGEMRDGHVRVGQHIPPEAENLPQFLTRFEEAYGRNLSKLRRIISVAASHHRLLWIHPFYDGNGRVARLFSHAQLLELGVGSSLWSVSRGLARNVEAYKASLMDADEPRRDDLDGRGTLTFAGLERFSMFFLATCVDQVAFMESLLEPEELLRRIEIYINEEVHAHRLFKGSWSLVREAVMAGEYARGKAPEITGYEERQARKVLNRLIEKGILVSPTSRSAVSLGFPMEVVDRWFPRLYLT